MFSTSPEKHPKVLSFFFFPRSPKIPNPAVEWRFFTSPQNQVVQEGGEGKRGRCL